MGFNANTLRRGNKQADRLSKLAEAYTKSESKSFAKDERYFQPEQDKAGKGEVVMRFLPELSPDAPLWVPLFTHSFQNGERWYIENSRTTLADPYWKSLFPDCKEEGKDPVADYFWKVRKPKTEEAKKAASKFSRKTYFISNILIVDDPAHPENNGKVFLFKYGKAIYDKIKDKLDPKFATDTKIDVFDPWEGANFHMKFYKNASKGGHRDYEKSVFLDKSPLADSDEELAEALSGQGYDLRAEVAPSKFKPYTELKEHFYDVMGWGEGATGGGTVTETKANSLPVDSDDLPWDDDAPKAATKAAAKPVSALAAARANKAPTTKPVVAADDELSEFADLADDD